MSDKKLGEFMKVLFALTFLTLFSAIAFAELTDFPESNNFAELNDLDYVDFRDLSLKTNKPGRYSWLSSCTSNQLYWDKPSRSYKKTIDNILIKGIDVVKVSGNVIKIISNSISSENNTRTFSETLITLTSANNYVKSIKRKTIYSDKTESRRNIISEGKYIEGTATLTRLLVDGQEESVNLSNSFSVLLNSEGTESYEAHSTVPSDMKANMKDPSVIGFMLKNEIICKTKTTKL